MNFRFFTSLLQFQSFSSFGGNNVLLCIHDCAYIHIMSNINLQSTRIIINILSKTFFTGDISIIRPHVIALEAILLFSVVS